MKKFMIMMLSVIVAVSLAACGEGKPSASTNSTSQNTESTTASTKSEGESREGSWVGTFKCEEIGDGIIISDDGSFMAYQDMENQTGKILGTYESVGDQWIFTSPGLLGGSQMGTFDGKNWCFGGDVYKPGFSSVTLGSLLPKRFGIYLNGTEKSVMGATISDLLNMGFKAGTDIANISVIPGGIMEMDVTYENATAQIKAVNVFEREVPLKDCRVCGFYTHDTNSIFQLDSEGDSCGQNNHDKLLDTDVYEYTQDKLVYKKYLLLPFYLGVTDESFGKQVIELDGHVDLTLRYNELQLAAFSFEFPDILYNGLTSNIDLDTLDSMDSESMEAIIEVRDDILFSLKSAFENVGVDININEISGEIEMDNGILFDTNSYVLSDNGKKYIDKFMSVYSTVVLSDEFSEAVSEVRFEGHTDSKGGYGYNQILSQKRAEAVMEYCLKSTENGLSEDQKLRLGELAIAKGYSFSNLIYDESGKENSDASRRVAIRFFVAVR